MASASEEALQPDEELAALMTSALEDFSKINTQKPNKDEEEVQEGITKATDSPGKGKSGKMPAGKSLASKKKNTQSPSDTANVDKMWKELIDADPALKDHWEKLAESCSKAADAVTEEEFEKSLNDTLKNLTDNAKSLAEGGGMADDELAKIWGKLGADIENGGANGNLPDIMPMVTNLMQNLLSKNVLYPALKELTEKYPAWLNDNKETLTEDEIKRYSHQLDLMLTVCKEFEAESPSDSESVKSERFQRILSVMQQMQECGSPPKDLVGDVPDLTSAGFDFPKIPGLGGDGSQCSIQ